MNLSAVRQALADVCTGWHAYAWIPGAVELPAAVVHNPARVIFARDYGGSVEVDVDLELTVARADEQAAQVTLDAAISTLASELMHARSTAWETVDRVAIVAGYRPVDVGGAAGLAVTLTLTLTA